MRANKACLKFGGTGFISQQCMAMDGDCTFKMKEVMEPSRESTSGLLFSQDSVPSNCLQHQAHKAGNCLTHHNYPLILSPSKHLLTALAQREETETLEPSCFSSLNETSSSVTSMPGASFTTPKKSSDNSQILSELDYTRGDSSFMYGNTLSSSSCIESIQCDDPGAEATTNIHTNRDRSSFSRLSNKPKEVNVFANDDVRAYTNDRQPLIAWDQRPPMHDMVTGSADRVPGSQLYTVSSSNNIAGLDLLVSAAIQVGFFDNQDTEMYNASFSNGKETDKNASEDHHCKVQYACPLQLSSPISKRRVVRRARSALSKDTSKDLLNRLDISDLSKNFNEKAVNVVEQDGNCMNTAKASHMQQQSQAIQYIRRKSLKTSSETVTCCEARALNTMHNLSETGCKQGDLLEASEFCKQRMKEVQIDKKERMRKVSANGSKQENLSEACDLFKQRVRGVQVNDMRYGRDNWSDQEDLLETSDVSKQKVKGVQIKEKKSKLQKQKKDVQVLSTSRLVFPDVKQPGHAVKEFCENSEDAANKEKNAPVPERIGCAEVDAEKVACIKFGGSQIRVKIQPVQLPSQAQMEAHEFQAIQQDMQGSGIRRSERLRMRKHMEVTDSITDSTKAMMSFFSDNQQLQANGDDFLSQSIKVTSLEPNILEVAENVSQGDISRRQGEQLYIEEHGKERNSNTQSMELMQCNSSKSSHTQLKDGDPLVRSKRGRSQVLPSKFSDSVLQPWKRAYRKRGLDSEPSEPSEPS